MLIVNLAIDLWRRRVLLQMCWLWRVMQFCVLGVGRKGRTITDQWDLFALTFWRLGIFPYTSIPPPCQHLLFTPYSMPGSVLGTEKCLSKSKAPMGDNERMISKNKKLQTVPQSLPFRSLCCLLLAWPKLSFPPFLALWPPETFVYLRCVYLRCVPHLCTTARRCGRGPPSCLSVLYLQENEAHGAFIIFFSLFLFLISICTNGLSSLLETN